MNLNKIIVVRPKDIVTVLLLKHKNTNEYSFVNLTKGHICPCRFKSINEAIKDLEERKKSGNIINYKFIEREELYEKFK